jgi:serine kinase of HPr protein (carbohydrate metabolism regulator)
MVLYGYEVSFDKLDIKQSENKLLKESKTLLVDNSYILELVNNQNRRVSITSNKPFLDNQTNQIINFLVEDIVTFSAEKNQNIIYYKIEKEGTESLVRYWLSHTFLPIIFTLENIYYFLHAGAVEIDSKPILFVADSFGGKSTLTDFFIKKNHTMISDDKVATYMKNETIYAVPSYPYHRPYRKVEDLGIYIENFAKENKPISKIYNLVKSNKDDKITINEIRGIKKFIALRYATDIELEVNNKSRFDMLSNIVNKIKVYDITIPWDLDRLEEVYQTIIEHNKKG